MPPEARLVAAMARGDLGVAHELARQPGLDPNLVLPGGLTPFLMAAWAGQAGVLECLHGQGGRGGDGLAGKSLADLALESRDLPTLSLALALDPATIGTDLPDGRFMRQARGLGLAAAAACLVATEARRRREALAERLDRALPEAGDAGGRERL